jgi:hypothetical protein
MRVLKRIAVACLIGAALIFIGLLWLSTDKRDDCLDSGGAWSEEQDSCIGSRPESRADESDGL